jgi:hypothetical protein
MPLEMWKLSKFSDVALEELPNELPSMHSIQHAINLVLGSQLPNLTVYRMNLSEHSELKGKWMSFCPGFLFAMFKFLCCPCVAYIKEK